MTVFVFKNWAYHLLNGGFLQYPVNASSHVRASQMFGNKLMVKSTRLPDVWFLYKWLQRYMGDCQKCSTWGLLGDSDINEVLVIHTVKASEAQVGKKDKLSSADQAHYYY